MLRSRDARAVAVAVPQAPEQGVAAKRCQRLVEAHEVTRPVRPHRALHALHDLADRLKGVELEEENDLGKAELLGDL